MTTVIRKAIRCHFTPCSTTVGPDGWLELEVDGATVEYAPNEIAPALLDEYRIACGGVIA